MDERVVYPGQADREAAQAAALARYMAAHEAVEPPPSPEQPDPPAPLESPGEPPKQPEPERTETLHPEKKGKSRLGLGVMALALLGGGWWWKDQQDQRVQQAQEQAAQQALAAEASRREREAERKRADDAVRAARLAQERQMTPTDPTTQSTGQTAALLHGRYQVLAGGSEVKDVQTGLVWARCSVGQRWSGKTCSGDAKTYRFDGTPNELDGSKKLTRNGWRVPTLRELYSLVWCSSGVTKEVTDLKDEGAIASHCSGDFVKPTIRTSVFPNTEGSYWTATTYESSSLTTAWYVDFYRGNVEGYDGPPNSFGAYNYVRLVRTSR